MSYDRRHFHGALLDALGAPNNDNNHAALMAWTECEGSDAAFNPLDTTWDMPGATPYNTFGNDQHVWNYPDEQTGVEATVLTLRQDFYPHILGALMSGSGRIVSGDARNDMRTWGTNADCIAAKLDGVLTPVHNGKPGVPFTDAQRHMVGRLIREYETRIPPLVDVDSAQAKRLIKAARRAVNR